MRSRGKLKAIAMLAVLLAACNAPAATGPMPSTAMPSVHPLREDILGLAGGDFQVHPTSAPGREPGVIFPLSLGHCGLGSPVDVDGSLWAPIGANDARGGPIDTPEEAGELVNATSGEAVIVGANRMDFRTPSGIVVVFTRHDGPRGYPGCM
jgi:hypothetical protein